MSNDAIQFAAGLPVGSQRRAIAITRPPLHLAYTNLHALSVPYLALMHNLAPLPPTLANSYAHELSRLMFSAMEEESGHRTPAVFHLTGQQATALAELRPLVSILPLNSAAAYPLFHAAAVALFVRSDDAVLSSRIAMEVYTFLRLSTSPTPSDRGHVATAMVWLAQHILLLDVILFGKDRGSLEGGRKGGGAGGTADRRGGSDKSSRARLRVGGGRIGARTTHLREADAALNGDGWTSGRQAATWMVASKEGVMLA
ncbi:hypothetical protein R3P38DRAFT_2784799 [Favolaschia claudopus]|uniref:Uncharacterized protein n=1 Tax=Favolaschia claudopus TaxID=2862362 RepID=A0AAW0AXX6_9AGAR